MRKIFFAFIGLVLTSITHATHHSVLIVGDSHLLGPFGKKLHSHLKQSRSDLKFHLYSSCGSIAGSWFKGWKTSCGYLYLNPMGQGKVTTLKTSTPVISQLLEEIKPSFVVLEFGTNYANANGTFSMRMKADIEKFVDEIRKVKAQCLFIGPPDVRKLRVGNQKINETLKSWEDLGCEYFDSQSVTVYPSIIEGSKGNGDGIHYDFPRGIETARNWAQQSSKWVLEHLSQRGPSSSKSHPKKTTQNLINSL